MKKITAEWDTIEIEWEAEEVAEAKPFRFFDLPYELRLRVFELILLYPRTIDLDPSNYRTIAPSLRMLLVCKRLHEEASRVFYGGNTFRIFPVHGRFFHTKAPLLARLAPRYHAHVTKMELRLGPGWTKPPKGWVVDDRLQLCQAVKLRMLKVFVECDPASSPVFEGFRNSETFYTEFSVALIRSIAEQVPTLEEVEFDAYPSVDKSSPLLQGLLDEVQARNKRITWGPERGWDKIVEVNLASIMGSLSLGAPSLPDSQPNSRFSWSDWILGELGP